MSRNGSGTYQLPAGNPVVPSTVISSTWANTTLSDIGTALTQSIANDGQTTPVANLPMATFRHTNVGNAVARNDYASAGQVQDSSLLWLTSVAGTNTITASITPSPTAYAAGQTFRFTAANANTGAATLNINGLGAKSIFKRGTLALVAGDIAASGVYQVVYDGTNFQLSNASFSAGSLINIQILTASGNYTPTAGTASIVYYLVGGGGGGGGAPATGAGQLSGGEGGAAGGLCIGRVTAGFSGAAFTIGAAGAANSGLAGGNGGNSTFLTATASGGTGGVTGGPSAPNFIIVGTTQGGGAATGADINIRGDDGTYGTAVALSAGLVSGAGGSTMFGTGGDSRPGSTAGRSASGFGAGGGGGANFASVAAAPGGAGAPGVLIIYEYA